MKSINLVTGACARKAVPLAMFMLASLIPASSALADDWLSVSFAGVWAHQYDGPMTDETRTAVELSVPERFSVSLSVNLSRPSLVAKDSNRVLYTMFHDLTLSSSVYDDSPRSPWAGEASPGTVYTSQYVGAMNSPLFVPGIGRFASFGVSEYDYGPDYVSLWSRELALHTGILPIDPSAFRWQSATDLLTILQDDRVSGTPLGVDYSTWVSISAGPMSGLWLEGSATVSGITLWSDGVSPIPEPDSSVTLAIGLGVLAACFGRGRVDGRSSGR